METQSPSRPDDEGLTLGSASGRIGGEPVKVVIGMLAIRKSLIHGLGAFAARDIAAGARVVEYVGMRITKTESIERCRQGNEFIFYLDSRWDLDGSGESNLARYLNHSCDPNCEARYLEGHIWMVALRSIRSGEELTFDYGYDREDYRDYPCRCGSPRCRRFIVASELMACVKMTS